MPRARHGTGFSARLLALLLGAAAATAEAGTAALLIDDLGYDRFLARRVLALPPPVAVAVLPDAPYSRAIARAAGRAGTDVLVHLPMEAEQVAPATGTLRVDMDTAAFHSRVAHALAAVPGAIGVNNHMGSRLTGERAPMDRLMRQLAAAGSGLVFIDSRTTADSRAEAAARAAGVGVARRDVFLDNVREPAAIAGQVRRWIERARGSGCALAIAHPYPETLRVLERVLPRADDIRRVDLRTYIARCGTPADGGASWRVSSYPSPTAAKSSKPSRSSTSSGAPTSTSSPRVSTPDR